MADFQRTQIQSALQGTRRFLTNMLGHPNLETAPGYVLYDVIRADVEMAERDLMKVLYDVLRIEFTKRC